MPIATKPLIQPLAAYLEFLRGSTMANQPALRKKGGAWTRVAVFITLYVLLLESLIEWVLVLYLYGNKQVDSKMTPSLVLALIASLFTMPVVSLHSFLAWHYNKVAGHVAQKNVLHTVCINVLRVNVIIWLATSVAGLVVVSQQASCLPDDAASGYWKVGVSCALHRAVVIVAVLSFITICVYFCSRELCDRPYDISLLGVYNKPHRSRDGSITSNSSWDSEDTLKNDVLYFCRRPDATYGAQDLHWSTSEGTIAEKPVDVPSIQCPAPVRAKPQLKLSTNPAPETAEIMSGSAVSSNGTVSNPVSRTSTVLTSQTTNEPHGQAPTELSGAPEVPQVPAKFSHKRNKSSVSLRRFFPKSLPISLPLSADPQIRALSNPNVHSDLEKQAEKALISKPLESINRPASPPKPQPSKSLPSTDISKPQSCPTTLSEPPQNQEQRTMTMSSDDAPEVVPGTQPEKVQRPNTPHHLSQPITRSAHHPHHPGHLRSVPSTPVMHSLTRGPSSAGTILPPEQPDRLRRHHSRRYGSMRNGRQSHVYQYEPSQVPRVQSHYHRPISHFHYPLRHNIGTVPRRNDVEIIYPSTRRSRSSTYGGIGTAAPLDSIKESRASFDEVPGHGNTGSDENTRTSSIIDGNTYRGTNWTSMSGSG